MVLLLELLHDQLLLLFECKLDILDSKKGLELPGQCVFNEYCTLVPQSLSSQPVFKGLHIHRHEQLWFSTVNDITVLVHCLPFVSKVHLPFFFPKAVLPKGDHFCFPQEEPPVLQVWPTVLIFHRVVASCILVGILSVVISTIWEFPTCVRAYKLIPRR